MCQYEANLWLDEDVDGHECADEAEGGDGGEDDALRVEQEVVRLRRLRDNGGGGGRDGGGLRVGRGGGRRHRGGLSLRRRGAAAATSVKYLCGFIAMADSPNLVHILILGIFHKLTDI